MLNAENAAANSEAQVKAMALAHVRTAQADFDAGKFEEAAMRLRLMSAVWAEVFPLRDDLEVLKKKVAEKQKLAREKEVDPPLPVSPLLEQNIMQATYAMDEANERLNSSREFRAKLKDEMASLQERLRKLQAIDDDLKVAKSDLTALNQKIHEMEFEGPPPSRIEIISSGDVPKKPEDRRLPVAASVGGGVLLVGLLLFGIGSWIASRRARKAAAA